MGPPAEQGFAEGVPSLPLVRQDPAVRRLGEGPVVPVEDAGPDPVHRVVGLEFGLQDPPPLVRAFDRLADELGECGEAGRVVDAVDDDALLFGGGHPDGEREPQGEQHGGHEDDEQGKQAGAHRA